MGELRLAAATLRDQSFDTEPLIPAAIAGPLADWLDVVALTWEQAARLDNDVVHYLTAEPSYPARVARAVVATFHG